MALETVSVDVPETALEAYEAALSSVCSGVSFFHNTTMDRWRVEGLKPVGRDEPALAAALALAGIGLRLRRCSGTCADASRRMVGTILCLVRGTADRS